MNRVFLVIAAAALSIGTAAMTLTGTSTKRTADHADIGISPGGNAAYRDGLHHGKLDAQRGREPHLSIGRWASDSNRRAFIAGYQQGYSLRVNHR